MEFKKYLNDLITIDSDNFRIGIKTNFRKLNLEKNIIDNKIEESRTIFNNTLLENKNSENKKLLEKIIENIGNNIKENIESLEITLSKEMFKKQSLDEYFNEYNKRFNEFGKSLRVTGKNSDITLNYISIYRNKDGNYFVNADDDERYLCAGMLYNKNAHYTFMKDVGISDIKNFKEVIKNFKEVIKKINMPEGYDNSGEIKNYTVYTLENKNFEIQIEKSDVPEYKTKIKIYNEKVKDSIAYINTQVPINTEQLLEKSIKIVNSIEEKEDIIDFMKEVILRMIVLLRNIKSETDNKCDSINIELHNKKPYEPFTNILPSIIGLNYNLSVTTNLNTAQCTYNNGKIDITMDDNCRNNIIIKADNFIKECEFEHKGFLSYRFRIKAIKTMTKMSNKVPQLSKITYDIGNKIANFENE